MESSYLNATTSIIEVKKGIAFFRGSISKLLYLLPVLIGQRILNFSKTLSIINTCFFRHISIFVMLGISYGYYMLIKRPSENLSKRIKLYPSRVFSEDK